MTEVFLTGLDRAADQLERYHIRLASVDGELNRLAQEIAALDGQDEAAAAVLKCRRDLAPCLQAMRTMQQVLGQISRETAPTELLVYANAFPAPPPAPLLAPVQLPAVQLRDWGLQFQESR